MRYYLFEKAGRWFKDEEDSGGKYVGGCMWSRVCGIKYY